MFKRSSAGVPGQGILLLKLLAPLGIRHVPHVGFPNSTCMNCGANKADFRAVCVEPDFDVKILPNSIRRLFLERAFGVCQLCGVAQDYIRFNINDVNEYITTIKSKDLTVSEEAFHSFPVPSSFIDQFNKMFFSVRLKKWDLYFDNNPIDIRRALFLRPNFGAASSHIKKKYAAECSGLEISSVSQKTVEMMDDKFQFLPGNIHAFFQGSFLDSGPYDAIFVFHTLVHCIDIHDSLAKLKGLLRPGGVLVFTHEISVKPKNPFHMLFCDEPAFLNILAKHFNRIDRIGECELTPEDSVSNYTFHGDCPDFVAWREMN